MNEHLNDLIRKAVEYQQALEHSKLQIEENRKTWNAETNPLIVNTFKTIAQNVPNLNWEIKRIDGMENLDILTLGFKNDSSGIVGQVEGVLKFFAKIGGKLIYSQVYNGDIYALIDYPHVEHHVERQSPKFVGKFQPAQITEDVILDHINEFLSEMLSWEEGTRKLIGFFNSK
jgi:hypothetical protein